MPLTQQQFEKHIAATYDILDKIHEAIIVKYRDAQLNINGYKTRANVLGENSIRLNEAYFTQAKDLETNSKEPYLTVEYQNEKNELVKTKLHRKNYMRYNFAAIFDEKYPHYNMQEIYRKKHNDTYITALEGPGTEEAAARMLYDTCINGMHTIYTLGTHDGMDHIHFNYYDFTTPKKFTTTFFNGEKCEMEITSKKITDDTDDYINEYELSIKISGDNKTYPLKVVNIKIPDGGTCVASHAELKKIFDNIHENNVAFHCAAGKSRTAIFPLAYIIAQEGLFEIDENKFKPEEGLTKYFNDLPNDFTEIFFDVLKKRPILAPTANQLEQIYAYGLFCAATKAKLEFPDPFYKLPEACCKQRAPKPKPKEKSKTFTSDNSLLFKKPEAKKTNPPAKKTLFIPTRINF